MAYAYRIMLEFVPNYEIQKKIKLISSDLIYHMNQNELPGCVPILNPNPNLLPSEDDIDTEDGRIYTIIFFRQHAFLVEIDFDTVSISFLDSLETYTDQIERTAIFDALKAVLEFKYSIDGWTEVNKRSVQQYYNDCVIFSLMNMRMRLLGLDHLRLVNLEDCQNFRHTMVEELMKSTVIGRKFFEKCGCSSDVLKQIEKREVQRKIITKMLDKRNQISELKKQLKLFEGITPPIKYAVNMRKKCTKLENSLSVEVNKYEKRFEKLRLMHNSFILAEEVEPMRLLPK